MAAKYVLKLSEEERGMLSRIAKGTRGKQAIAAWKVVRAKALLKCDQGEFGPAWTDEGIAEALDVTERSIQNWRKKAVLEGPEAALVRKPRVVPPVPPKGCIPPFPDHEQSAISSRWKIGVGCGTPGRYLGPPGFHNF